MKKLDRTFALPVGAGTVNHTLDCLRSKPNDYFARDRRTDVFVVTAKEVNEGDISRITSLTMGAQQQLQKVAGRVHFCFETASPGCEIYEDPDIRAYVHRVTVWWPAWTFAGNPDGDCFRVLMLALLKNLHVVRQGDRVTVHYREEEMYCLFHRCLPLAATLHHRAGIPGKKGCRQLQRVARTLQIPEV